MPTFVTKRMKSFDLNGNSRKEKSLCRFHFFACENLSAYLAISICISNLGSADCGLSRAIDQNLCIPFLDIHSTNHCFKPSECRLQKRLVHFPIFVFSDASKCIQALKRLL